MEPRRGDVLGRKYRSVRILGRSGMADEAVAWMLQLCRGLTNAHHQGIVHRAPKPGLTQSGALLGSPLYMLPEQVRSTRDVDARNDLWAAGVVRDEIPSGGQPFTGASFRDIRVNILTASPARLRGARADLPVELERVVARSLEKPSARRPASVDDLAVALAPVRADEPVPGTPSTLDLSVREVRAHPPRRAARTMALSMMVAAAIFLVARQRWTPVSEAASAAATPVAATPPPPDAGPPPSPRPADAAPPSSPDAWPRGPKRTPPRPTQIDIETIRQPYPTPID